MFDLVVHTRHRTVFVLLELCNEALTKIDDVLRTRFLRFKQVVVDEVRFVQVLFELVQALPSLPSPLVGILKKPIRHPLQPAYLLLDELQVSLEDALGLLLLYLEHRFQLRELFFQVVLEFV